MQCLKGSANNQLVRVLLCGQPRNIILVWCISKSFPIQSCVLTKLHFFNAMARNHMNYCWGGKIFFNEQLNSFVTNSWYVSIFLLFYLCDKIIKICFLFSDFFSFIWQINSNKPCINAVFPPLSIKIN